MMLASFLRLPLAVRQQIWARVELVGGTSSSSTSKSISPHRNGLRLGSRRGYATVYPTEDSHLCINTNHPPRTRPYIEDVLEATRAALDAHTSISTVQKDKVLREVQDLIRDTGISNPARTRRAVREKVGEHFADDSLVRSVQNALLVLEAEAIRQSEAFREILSQNQTLLSSLTEKYPDAPTELFKPDALEPRASRDWVEASLERLRSDASGAGSSIVIKKTKSVSPRRTRAYSIDITSKRGSVCATGEGSNTRYASITAYINLLHMLDTCGALGDIYTAPSHDEYPGGRSPPEGVLADVAYMQHSMQLPPESRYPVSERLTSANALKQGFEAYAAPNLIADITRACYKLDITSDVKWQTQTFRRSDCVVCKLSIDIPGLTALSAIGEGQDEPMATAAAQLHLLAKLHDNGAFERMFREEETSNRPTPQQYPHAPQGLFVLDTVSQEFSNLSGRLRSTLHVKATLNLIDTGIFHTCELEVEIPGHFSISSKGVGSSGKLAKKDAWMQVVKDLHANGVLAQLFSDPNDAASEARESDLEVLENGHTHEMDNVGLAGDVIHTGQATHVGTSDLEDLHVRMERSDVTSEAIKAERNAKVEVYNFAAGIGLIPEFDARLVKPRTLRERRNTRLSPLVLVTARLAALEIEVQGIGRDVKAAEIDAAIRFKRMADGKVKNVRPPLDDKYRVLSADTARKFFDFLRISERRADLELEHELVLDAGTVQNKARLTVNGDVEQTVVMSTKKDAEAIVHLAAAVTVASKEPALLQEFSDALRRGRGNVFRLLRPVKVSLGHSALELVRKAMIDARRMGLPDHKEVLPPAEESKSVSRNRRLVLSAEERGSISQELQARAQSRSSKGVSQDGKCQENTEPLPMTQYCVQVLNLLAKSDYSIIIGATGSGKSTQVPQIILDDAIAHGRGGFCDIICTQPRRLAASSVARRVAAERGERLEQSVGYQVRFDSKTPRPGGSITYCTTGVLLEHLKHDPEILNTVSHIVLDEVHERTLPSDLLMIVLKRLIKARQHAKEAVPKIILMSATMDAGVFSRYFGSESNGDIMPCPVLNVPGRTFPVREHYLHDIISEMESQNPKQFKQTLSLDPASRDYIESEGDFSLAAQSAARLTAQPATIDWKREQLSDPDESGTSVLVEKRDALVPIALIATTIAHICKISPPGAILAFLPGLQEITKTRDVLGKIGPIWGLDFNNELEFKILLLHSTIPPEEQQAVFEETTARRKIILSTNIAETSVTVPDVKYVIDSGKLREERYDQIRRMTQLQCTWVAQSNARQRAGRAGRVQEGHYYALYSEVRKKGMPASGLPELLRSDLQETCLSIKARGFQEPLTEFLDQAMQPPPSAAVKYAVQNLQVIEALTEDQSLTTLGRVLSTLPLHPALAKMVVLGILFRCLDPILIVSSLSDERSLFVTPAMQRETARQSHQQYDRRGVHSDHLAELDAYEELRTLKVANGWAAVQQRAHANFLHFGVFRSVTAIADQIYEVLQTAGLVPQADKKSRPQLQYGGERLNVNSKSTVLIRCLLTAGLHPNIGLKRTGKSRVYRTPTEEPVFIHSSSQNRAESPALLTFGTLSRSSAGDAAFMRDTTAIDPLMALLFGGKLQTRGATGIDMDGWLPFELDNSNAAFATKLVFEFRKALDRMLNVAFKSLSVDGGQSLANDPVIELLVNAIVQLLEQNFETDDVPSAMWRQSASLTTSQ